MVQRGSHTPPLQPQYLNTKITNIFERTKSFPFSALTPLRGLFLLALHRQFSAFRFPFSVFRFNPSSWAFPPRGSA